MLARILVLGFDLFSMADARAKRSFGRTLEVKEKQKETARQLIIL